MPTKYYALIEMGFTGLIVVGFILWQLRSVNREIAHDKTKRDSPDSARHPVGEHRLDDR